MRHRDEPRSLRGRIGRIAAVRAARPPEDMPQRDPERFAIETFAPAEATDRLQQDEFCGRLFSFPMPGTLARILGMLAGATRRRRPGGRASAPAAHRTAAAASRPLAKSCRA